MRHVCVAVALASLASLASLAAAQEKPTLVIGGVDDRVVELGDPKTILVAGNRILVVEGKAPFIRVISSVGKLMQTLGRMGAGPGEFSTRFSVAYDSTRRQLLVFDAGNSRISYFAIGDTLTFAGSHSLGRPQIGGCVVNGTAWTLNIFGKLMSEIDVTGPQAVERRSVGESKWLDPRTPRDRMIASIAPYGAFVCDGRTNSAVVASNALGEYHVLGLIDGAQRLAKLDGYALAKTESSPNSIMMTYPENGIYDSVVGGVLSGEGIEVVIERHANVFNKAGESVSYFRMLLLPNGTQRITVRSKSRPMTIAQDGIYCYSTDPAPTLSRYASGRCP